MKFTINHNRDKADIYAAALKERGHIEIRQSELELMPLYHQSGMTYIQNPKDAEFVIVDHNWTEAAIGTLRWAKGTGRPAFKIPHGARGDMFIDSIKFPNPLELVNFVPAPGYKQVYDAGGYPAETVVTGWPWSEVKEFKPSLPLKVMFAPIHPRETARLIPGHKHINKVVCSHLKKLARRFEISFYIFKEPVQNELPDNIDEWADVVRSTLRLDDAVKAIENVDLVIAHETLASLAVAVGKPTIMVDDTIEGVGWFTIRTSKYWPHYDGKMNYPFSWMKHEGDKEDFIKRVATDSKSIQTWKKNFIGDPFDKEVFVNKVESYLHLGEKV